MATSAPDKLDQTAAQTKPNRAAWMLRALRHRNYRLFFGGQIVSLAGSWMTQIAMTWLVYRLTGSALLLGVVAFTGQIPAFVLGPFAGVMIDRCRAIAFWSSRNVWPCSNRARWRF